MTGKKIDAAYLAVNPLPVHGEGDDKHSRGRVLVIAGSVAVPGAALLAGLGALRSGAGVLQIATCKSIASLAWRCPKRWSLDAGKRLQAKLIHRIRRV